MDSKIECRIDSGIKHHAKESADRLGITISDAIRALIERMADEQLKAEQELAGLKSIIDDVMDKLKGV